MTIKKHINKANAGIISAFVIPAVAAVVRFGQLEQAYVEQKERNDRQQSRIERHEEKYEDLKTEYQKLESRVGIVELELGKAGHEYIKFGTF